MAFSPPNEIENFAEQHSNINPTPMAGCDVSVQDITTEKQLMEPKQIINLNITEDKGIRGEYLTGILTSKSNIKTKMDFNTVDIAPVFRPDNY